ncbi:phosphoribosylformylglycinamidine cyclo-ligase [Candidatus Thorarchaeota archaeon]|nr:MAG: phosphoribosylformylglycinamidine cyclo-ligase [Candidatus Thorarchaeota archaeon]
MKLGKDIGEESENTCHRMRRMLDVLIVSGSKSDNEIVKKVTDTLTDLGIKYVAEVASAHREPEKVRKIVKSTGASVIIAIAGLSAALPGFIASLTPAPVIGVPVSAALGGLDSLLSIAQMPKGVPVATVGIDNGQNAAHLAARILRAGGEYTRIPRTYAEAGVDEKAIEESLKIMGDYVRESFQGSLVGHDYGHFANTVQINDDICLGMSTDGVGSKVLIAQLAEKFDTIGIDCVAMNVNDLICIGLDPIAFVDYLALHSTLPAPIMEQIGEGLLKGCQQCGIPILGGETALLPDIIRAAQGVGMDLAGTAVGISHPHELIDGSAIMVGDAILGIQSSGLHSNGFTLARKVILTEYRMNQLLPWGERVDNELLRPTKIYVNHIRSLKENGIDLRGIAHITGNAFKKLLRLGKHRFRIQRLPDIPPIFSLIQRIGDISNSEMFSTFNMGIGMVVVVPDDEKDNALEILRKHDETTAIGVVEESVQGVVDIEPFGVTLE